MLDNAKLLLLKTELAKDEYAADVAAGYHYNLAKALNETLTSHELPKVPVAAINSYCDSEGISLAVDKAAENHSTEQIKDAARIFQAIFKGRYTEVTPTLPRVGLVLDALVVGGVITAEQKAGILALKDVQVPISQKLVGQAVTSMDVADALNL